MNNSGRSRKYIVLEPLLLALMMVIGISIGYKINDTEDDFSLIERLEDGAAPIGRVEEILRFVENKYVDSVDTELIENELIETVLQDLDPHSIYIPPTDLAEINKQMSGKFEGLGIETLSIKDTFYVSYVMENSPAEAAELKIGTQLLSVNDSIVSGRNLVYDDFKNLVLNQNQISLGIQYKGQEKIVKIEPKEFAVSSTKNHFMLNDETGYIHLERFTSKSYADFMKSLESLVVDQKLDNLIIDLRNNPGGYLPETSKILSQLFKEKDRLLLYTEGEKSEKLEYKSTGKCFFDIGNIAVLINEGSASGSEIVAGAIQDWDRGVIIGSRSYGKGLVQEQYDLQNGGAIRLTVARYYTPSGRLIQKEYRDVDYNYEDEVANRERNTEESFDSSEFKTLKLKRSVISGGGIQPDIRIPRNAQTVTAEYLELRADMELHLFIENLHNDLDHTSESALSVILEKMKFKLNQDGIPSYLLTKHEELLMDDIEIFLSKWNVNRNASKKIEVSHQLEIQEALKTFKNKKVLAEFVF